MEKNYNTHEPNFLVWEDNINGRKHNPNTCKDFYFLKIQALQEYNNFILKSPIDANLITPKREKWRKNTDNTERYCSLKDNIGR